MSASCGGTLARRETVALDSYSTLFFVFLQPIVFRDCADCLGVFFLNFSKARHGFVLFSEFLLLLLRLKSREICYLLL